MKTLWRVKPLQCKPIRVFSPSFQLVRYRPLVGFPVEQSSTRDLTYHQARLQGYHIQPLDDTDQDRRRNISDCSVFNPGKQGMQHFFKNRSKQQQEIPGEPPLYIMVKINGQWINCGTYPQETIDKMIEQTRVLPEVEDIVVSSDPGEIKQLNAREIAHRIDRVLQPVEQTAASLDRFARKRQWPEHIKQGMHIHQPALTQLKHGLEHGSSRPPLKNPFWNPYIQQHITQMPTPGTIGVNALGHKITSDSTVSAFMSDWRKQQQHQDLQDAVQHTIHTVSGPGIMTYRRYRPFKPASVHSF